MRIKITHSALRNVLIGLFAASLLLVGEETIKLLNRIDSVNNSYAKFCSLMVFYVLFFLFYFELFRMFHQSSDYTNVVVPEISKLNTQFVGASVLAISLTLLSVAYLPILIFENTFFFYFAIFCFVLIDFIWSHYVRCKLRRIIRKRQNTDTLLALLNYEDSLTGWIWFDSSYATTSAIAMIGLHPEFSNRAANVCVTIFILMIFATIALFFIDTPSQRQESRDITHSYAPSS